MMQNLKLFLYSIFFTHSDVCCPITVISKLFLSLYISNVLKCSSEHENENKKCEFTEVAPVLVQAHGTIISKHTLLAI